MHGCGPGSRIANFGGKAARQIDFVEMIELGYAGIARRVASALAELVRLEYERLRWLQPSKVRGELGSN